MWWIRMQKGISENATSPQRFIKKRAADDISDFYLFSDRCGWQNNNCMIFIMLSGITHTCKIKSITLIYLVSENSHSENDNTHSVIEQISRKKTIYTPAQWEAAIQCAFKKNSYFLEVLEQSDIIDFKSTTAFPEFKSIMLDKMEDKMMEKEMTQQKALNESLGLAKQKVKKVYWSEIV